jgi:ATP-dependent Lhr-like helicase
MRAEDLLAAVFPDAIACQDNMTRERERRIPDHPLVQETLRDCLTEAMDVDGLTDVLGGIEAGTIRCVAIDTPSPSPFSHEILNANPYAFLDDAPLEERRARAVALRRTLPGEMAEGVGSLDLAAIDEVVRESWPVVRDADDLHDALLTLVWVPAPEVRGWQQFLPELVQSGRATEWAIDDGEPMPVVQRDHKTIGWVATEQLTNVQRALAGDDEATVDAIVLGWMESIGPVTAVMASNGSSQGIDDPARISRPCAARAVPAPKRRRWRLARVVSSTASGPHPSPDHRHVTEAG